AAGPGGRPRADPDRPGLARRWREFEQLPTLKEHWYWRPGWRAGRSYYTWHLTFSGQRVLHDLVRHVQAALSVAGLDLVPVEGLHLTMQGVGFTDEVSRHDLDAIVAAVRQCCAGLGPMDLSLGPVDPDEEGVGLLVSPWGPIEDLRMAVRRGIGSVWDDVPEPAAGFRPHVTIAYSGAAVPTAPLRERLVPLLRLPPAKVRVDEAQLIALRRDDR